MPVRLPGIPSARRRTRHGLIKCRSRPCWDSDMELMMDTFRSTDLCETLRQAILQGDYKFGTRLKIDEIARRYRVSHMPVRKALLQLEGEQLVTTSRNRGASVRAIDVEFVG